MSDISLKSYALPHTSLSVSAIGLGASPFGDYVDASLSERQLDIFVEYGGCYIDTARTYGRDHSSERMVGQWLAQRRNRERIVLATKGGQELEPTYIRTLRRNRLNEHIDGSLKRLQTDYIDLYYLHVDDESVPVEEIIDTLDDKVKEGKIRYIGCSNWTAERIEAANTYAEQAGKTKFSVSQMEWSLATLNHPNVTESNNIWMDRELYAFHRRTQLAAFAYSPQARGFFSKLDQLGAEGIDAFTRKQYWSEANLDRLHRLQQLSSETGYSIATLVLAYISHQRRDFFSIPIISCRTEEQLMECLKAESCVVDADMLAYLGEGRYE